MKNCLVTGGAGFIGSHLCDTLMALKYKVICVDNFQTGRQENINHLFKNSNFEFIKHDVIKPLKIKKRKIKFVYHLASPASPRSYQDLSLSTMLVNSLGTFNMLKLARQHQAKFLLASTSEVYGDPLEHPQKESYWGNVNPVGIRSCYDESKRFAEAITMVFYRQFKVDTRIVRIFNTYGPRVEPKDGRVISNFIVQALTNMPLTIYGKGQQTRSFCYVSDLVDGLLRSMENKKTRGEVINLGNPQEDKIIFLAKLIKKMCQSKTKLVFRPLPEDDPQRRRPDIAKAKEILNWSPRVNLEEGLNKTIAYFRQRL